MPTSSTQMVTKTLVRFKLEDGTTTWPMVLKAGIPSADHARELAMDKAPEGAIRYQTMRVTTPRRGRVSAETISRACDKTGFRKL